MDLYSAILQNNDKRVQVILKKNKKHDFKKALLLAVQVSTVDIVKIILFHSETSDIPRKLARAACLGENVKVLEYLLLLPEIHVDNLTLRFAVTMDSYDCANILRNHPAVISTTW